ncbi:hypothetical protein VPH35_102526 [Triticum aestivum]
MQYRTMTTPSLQFLSQQQLLLLLPAVILLVVAAVADAQGQLPGCGHKCGNIDIPFPFGIGIGPGCFGDGFEVLCNDSYHTSRAFLRGTNGSYFPSPYELLSIAVEKGEARVLAPIASRCNTDINVSFSAGMYMDLVVTPFTVSVSNVLIGVGATAVTMMQYTVPAERIFSCLAYDFGSVREEGGNGNCTAGCCEFSPSTLTKDVRLSVRYIAEDQTNMMWSTFPCAYGMLVEKSWYEYYRRDMFRYTLLNRTTQGVPLTLNFAAGKGSCLAKGQVPPPEYACISGNSSCANATYSDTPGYMCKCLDGYAGNPYVANGCQDIVECEQPEVYPCSNEGTCKNKLGGYDCPCKFGMKGDGKTGTCTPVFTPAAKATVGAIAGVLLLVIISFLVILRKEKKKAKEFYRKNGGPTLEKANVIKLFRKDELKPILKKSNLIGKGCFGEVYKGILDNKLVAVKKPINGSVLESDQFANEVIIQSQVIHKNIVRLIGCCLEVDAPMLVYEFISQGSLHDILHNSNNKVAFNLDARLSIATHSADGLAYMHSKTNNRILHGDVKPANILLDDNFIPKISDFGISRLIASDKEHSASIIGDMNYMDPVYLQEGLLTEKSDVYSFGVVILELISRERAIHSDNNKLVKNFLEAHMK